MKVIDISQGVFGAALYPGDPAPRRELLCEIARGDAFNLTAVSLCAHTGTHIDAPSHFIGEGKTVSDIPPEVTVGQALVLAFDGVMGENEARSLLLRASEWGDAPSRRLLIKGDATVTAAAAEVLAASERLLLFGVESQSVGPLSAPMAAHIALLSRGVVLLEGLRLGGVKEGSYLLSAAPLLLEGAEGAPCRAVLVDFEEKA